MAFVSYGLVGASRRDASIAICRRSVRRSSSRSVRMMSSSEDPVVESTPATEELVAPPKPFAQALLTNLALPLGGFAALKFGLAGKFSPIVNPIGYYALWIGITGLPFLLNQNRIVSIAEMESRKSLNTDLVAPAGFTQCSPEARLESPTYDCSPMALRNKFFTMVKEQPDTSYLGGSDDDLRYGFVQVTKLMRYPDVITVEFLPSGTGSTLAIFSTSIFGQSDLGANKARVDKWIEALDTKM